MGSVLGKCAAVNPHGSFGQRLFSFLMKNLEKGDQLVVREC